MEWHQLEYFRTVAQLQHFTRAAETLAISQPALSRSIARLEDELGIPLFERQGKKIALNRYGQIFLRHVDRAMQEIIYGKQAIQDLLNPDHGTIPLAFLHSLGTHFIPDLLSKYRQLYPLVKFKLYQNATHALLEQLDAGEIDLCFSAPIVPLEKVDWAPLFTEELFVAVPADHALARHEAIKLSQIATEPIITFKPRYGLRIIADQLFSQAGFKPAITFEGEEIMTVAGLVEAKLGVAIIPRIAGLEQAQLSFLHISEPLCQRTIGIAWMSQRYLSPAAIRFRDFVIRSFK